MDSLNREINMNFYNLFIEFYKFYVTVMQVNMHEGFSPFKRTTDIYRFNLSQEFVNKMFNKIETLKSKNK